MPESLIEKVKTELMSKRGFKLVSGASAPIEDNCVITRPVVPTIYGESHSKKNSLVIHTNGHSVRIFVFDQNSSGSADEKLPFLYLSSLLCEEDYIVFVINGSGIRKVALDWLKSAVQQKLFQTTDKKIWVKSLTEFSAWLDTRQVNKKSLSAPRGASRKKESYSFLTERAFSKEAVALVVSFLQKNKDVSNIKNVENDLRYQKEDVDVLYEKNGIKIKAEIKADRYFDTGNIAIELVSNKKTGKRGWVFESAADELWYTFPATATAYVVSLADLKKWTSANYDRFYLKTTKTKTRSTEYMTQFIAVPISELEKNLVNFKKIALG